MKHKDCGDQNISPYQLSNQDFEYLFSPKEIEEYHKNVNFYKKFKENKELTTSLLVECIFSKIPKNITTMEEVKIFINTVDRPDLLLEKCFEI